ncbi:hypothetical protein EHM69_07570 [candidate division KSB1 bacterium]|nr:MAG: hypothetical protein EHM69_07570 [candidate division KSB1 bacterium]
MRVQPYRQKFWELQWGSANGDPLAMPYRIITRSLTRLMLGDATQGYEQFVVPLPEGRGAEYCLNSKIKAEFALTLTARDTDSLLSLAPRRIDARTFIYRGADSVQLIVAASVKIDSALRLSGAKPSPEWSFRLAETRRARLLFAFCSNQRELNDAIMWSRRKVERLERDLSADISDRLEFSLRTEDDRTNQVFACLAMVAAGADACITTGTQSEIETAAMLSPALFLASHQPSSVVFPGAGKPAREKFTPQEMRDHLRWGGPAYRAALQWGMADDDTLRRIALDVLTGLSSLQRDYVTSDLEVVADAAIEDSLMRLSVAHIRMADLWSLGAEICDARGDHTARGEFRKEMIRAERKARQLFNESARRYLRATIQKQDRLETFLDTTEIDEEEPETSPLFSTYPVFATYPDTALYLQAGAKYGFNWLDNQPAGFWSRRLAVDGFVWQRYVAYRFRNNWQITETRDFDSLTALILEGPLPGLLGSGPIQKEEPSLAAMAAAFQNLAEVYLGIHPDGFRHRVTIEPRTPASWGRTKARVPFSSGYLLLDYDFANQKAIVGMAGLQQQVDVYFGFPLPEGGFVRTQFTLMPGGHPIRIEIVRDKRKRVDIRTEEVP